MLAALAGIAFTFFTFWIIKAGEYSDSLLNVLVAGIAVGPFVGIFVVLLFSALLMSIAQMTGLTAKLKNTFGITAYALIPIVISLILVLPIEILTFGFYFFTKSPSPFLLKPVSYVVLMGLDGIFTLWSLVLLLTGIKILLNVRWVRACVLMLVSLSITIAGIAGLLHVFVL